jgi:hypothetical protein
VAAVVQMQITAQEQQALVVPEAVAKEQAVH